MPQGGANSGKGAQYAWIVAHVDFDGRECLTWPFTLRWNGYGIVGYKGKILSPHRIMCELVNGEPPTPKHVAAHSCNNGHLACIHPKHVSWKTPRQNMLDRRAAGTLTTKRWQSRVTNLAPDQIARIIDLRGRMNQRDIGKLFGISYQHVSVIQNRKLRRQAA